MQCPLVNLQEENFPERDTRGGRQRLSERHHEMAKVSKWEPVPLGQRRWEQAGILKTHECEVCVCMFLSLKRMTGSVTSQICSPGLFCSHTA